MINIDNHDYEVDKQTRINPPKKKDKPQTQKNQQAADKPDSPPATKSQASGAAADDQPHHRQGQARPQPEEEPAEQPVNERILLLQQRADAGDANAQFELGQHYYFGNEDLGIEPHRGEAMHYYQMAANNNHPEASVDMSFLLLNSRPL